MQEELEKFFIATDDLEDRQLKILGWKGPKAALKTIKTRRKSFRASLIASADGRSVS
jgi:inorganic pyrophosphatase